MNFITVILSLALMTSSTLYDFNSKKQASDWRIVDDVVMGGRSSGNFAINDEGYGVFSGIVSIENNGGFSSVRTILTPTSTEEKQHFVIRLKGDGKDYQFRVKPNKSDYFSYIYSFQTNKEWQEIKIPFSAMYPSFRGRKLDMPNYSGNIVEEMTFLIANKKNESFRLEIDWIKSQ